MKPNHRRQVPSPIRLVALLAGLGLAGRALPGQAAPLPPSIGTPLLAAQHMLAAGKYQAALADVAQAERVPNQTPPQQLTVDQMRAAIDARSGNGPAAISAYRKLLADPALPAAQRLPLIEGIASSYYQAHDYAAAAAWISAHLAGVAQYHGIMLQSYEQAGQCSALARALQSQPAAHGAAPPKADLQMLVYCYGRQKDMTGYVVAMQRLVAAYPSTAAWTALLDQMQGRSSFGHGLTLDVYRLKSIVGVPVAAHQYVELTEDALADKLPNEAVASIGQGYRKGILGSGPKATEQARLRQLAAKQRAALALELPKRQQDATARHDAATLFNVGQNEVDGGNFKAGVPLMEQAIREGGMRHVERAKLRMGEAYFAAGHHATAVRMWQAVAPACAAGRLAALWIDVKRPGAVSR